MKVAFITPEAMPFSKTGGLADVSLSLPTALAELGVECTVFTPLCRQAAQYLAAQQVPVEKVKLPFELWIGDDSQPLHYLRTAGPGFKYVLVANDSYFNRDHPYLAANGKDYPDNAARFAFFCRAVLEYCLHLGGVPDIMHANDWQSALIPIYLNTTYSQEGLANVGTILTIHNLGFQGVFPAEHIYATGLDWKVFTPEYMEFYGKLNLLKGGIALSKAVTTVSPSYAAEIQTADYGHGLEGLLACYKEKITGILNGIDTRAWNPATDPHLPCGFTEKNMTGKKQCRRLLQRELGLPLRPDCMLLGTISRLDRQKGIELLAEVFPTLARLDIQLVILGSGDKELEVRLTDLAARYPEQVALRLGYDEPLAHRITAGSDAFLMPSRYEPCGLTQMYSQRYGTVPIVRETGGLRDTVCNYTPRRMTNGSATGFTFRAFEARKLAEAIYQAARLYFTDRKTWNRLARRVMSLDYSWSASARAYNSLYRQLARTSRAGSGGEHV